MVRIEKLRYVIPCLENSSCKPLHEWAPPIKPHRWEFHLIQTSRELPMYTFPLLRHLIWYMAMCLGRLPLIFLLVGILLGVVSINDNKWI